jgi:hypothetical protein
MNNEISANLNKPTEDHNESLKEDNTKIEWHSKLNINNLKPKNLNYLFTLLNLNSRMFYFVVREF